MGYKDLQVLLLLVLGVRALAKDEALPPPPASAPPPTASNDPPPPVPIGDFPPLPPPPIPQPPSPPPPPSLNSIVDSLHLDANVTSYNWTVGTTDINSMDKNILTSENKRFSFSLMVTNHSACAAVVQHVLSKVIIWVANFNSSTQNASVTECMLSFKHDGLVLINDVGTIWSTYDASKQINAQYLMLDNSGRLFFWSTDQKHPEWESFEHPTDILVPGQKLNLNYSLSAAQWNGEYSNGYLFFMRVDRNQVILYENFTDNGVSRITPYFEVFRNNETVVTKDIYVAHVELQQDGLYVVFSDETNSSVPNSIPESQSQSPKSDWYFVRLGYNGGLTIFSYLGAQQLYSRTINSGDCLLPGQCGYYGICSGVKNCTCPDGFKEFNVTSPGCERKEILNTTICTEDTFISVPGNTYIQVLNNATQYVSADSCKETCSNNCTCQMALYVKENQTSQGGTCYLNLGNSMQTIRQNGTNETFLQTLFLRIVNGSDLPFLPRPSTGSSRKTVALAFAGGAGTLAFVLFALSALFLYYKRQWLFEDAEKGKYDSAAAELLLTKPLPQFTYQEVVESTGNFAQKLGSGGFSCVYLGHLPDNTKIAVKKLDDDEHKEKEFLEAVTTVGSISHTNLVSLKGFCSEGQHRILVYELVNDGRSLNWFLFPLKNSGSFINAQTRRSIALGTARGLAHLHDGCNSSGVLHGGVKPENIVIDKKMHPRLVDFGLIDLMSRDQRLNEAHMRGLRGYMAPEWVKYQRITEKVDVYSLGIVILELVSGRRCFKQGASPERCFLPSWGFSLLRDSEHEPDRVLELVDPLLDVWNLPATDQQVLKGMIYVALWCVQEEASMRPPMKEVVRMLEGDASVDTPPYSPALDVFAREVCEGYAGERAPESSNNSFMHSNSLKRNSDMRLR